MFFFFADGFNFFLWSERCLTMRFKEKKLRNLLLLEREEKKLKDQALLFHKNQGNQLLIEQKYGNSLSKKKMIVHNAIVVSAKLQELKVAPETRTCSPREITKCILVPFCIYFSLSYNLCLFKIFIASCFFFSVIVVNLWCQHLSSIS